MMELYYVMTVVDRDKEGTMEEICERRGVSLVLENLGRGTARDEHLRLYDLRQTEKSIVCAIAGRKALRELILDAKERLYIDIPGNGILMAVPIKSVSGGKALALFTENQEIGGGVPTMEFKNEMIIVILNEGYSDTVMDAARTAGATGGTVLHAKGTGKHHAEKFYGVTIAEEKDMIYILAPTDKKSAIMQAINKDCGMGTPAGAVSFSVPVSEVVGIRSFDRAQEELKEAE